MIPFANAVQGELGTALLVTELIIIAAVAIAVKWIRLPYTIALVTAGLGVGLLRAQAFIDMEIALTPELVFTVFLPVLLFEAAFNLQLHHLKENAKPIALFSISGVLIASLLVGYALHWIFDMPLYSALVFGALISATDPISVMALFKQLKAPARLSIIVEGESLFNDGAAVVVFKIFLALALTGKFSLSVGILQFLVMSLGGLLLGVILGYVASKVTAAVDDHLIEITLSTILAYGSYIVAEHMGVSGVMAVIAAGLVFGSFGKTHGMSPHTQIMMGAFWEYAGFVMNSFVFLLIGTQVDLRLLAGDWQRILVAFVCVLLARAVAIIILGPIAGKLDRPLPMSWHTVFVWAGLRGSISMALAIGLPVGLPWREDILLMTFGVVILSLFLQGLTMPKLLRMLGVVGPVPPEIAIYEKHLGQFLMHRRCLEELHIMRENLTISGEVFHEMSAPHEKAMTVLQKNLVELGRQQVSIRHEQIRDAKKHLMTVQMATLQQANERNLISDEVKEALIYALANEELRDLEAEESSHLQSTAQPQQEEPQEELAPISPPE